MVRVELPELLTGDGDLGDPELEWPSLPAKVPFQVGYELRLDEASTASHAMEPPRIRGSNYQFDVLLLAVPGPLSCVGEMVGHDLLQFGASGKSVGHGVAG